MVTQSVLLQMPVGVPENGSEIVAYDGMRLPLPNAKMRLCSRKRPTIDFTWMFSDKPGTPGRRQQMPRTTARMRTPAADAA